MNLMKKYLKKLETPDTAAEFDRLFHEHMERLRQYDIPPDGIDTLRLAEIHRAVEHMDEAWLRGDLQRFKEAMQEAEQLYYRVGNNGRKR